MDKRAASHPLDVTKIITWKNTDIHTPGELCYCQMNHNKPGKWGTQKHQTQKMVIVAGNLKINKTLDLWNAFLIKGKIVVCGGFCIHSLRSIKSKLLSKVFMWLVALHATMSLAYCMQSQIKNYFGQTQFPASVYVCENWPILSINNNWIYVGELVLKLKFYCIYF